MTEAKHSLFRKFTSATDRYLVTDGVLRNFSEEQGPDLENQGMICKFGFDIYYLHKMYRC